MVTHDPQRLVTGTVGDDGTIRAEIPKDAALGDHRIVVQDGEGTLVGWAPIEIAAAGEAVASGEDGELAVTGSSWHRGSRPPHWCCWPPAPCWR